ncbi:unnamed protein product [Darwinula stevensoni]|uniref:procollagen-lysine 5-dioxygenase n=1 Tax=Darwinula stevensoni TaxID=69355 RepID=A0A7R8X538_9CRUS|nr:unnamed protein product [Darwinula stevensoni]CAG0886727.1 unnamed protein product [Darwinula stevensoni]
MRILGMGEEWKGGDVMRSPGGAQKIHIIRNAMQKWKDDPKKIVMFTDSYDVVLLGSPEQVKKEFEASGARVLFSAEAFCWPDDTLIPKYPAVENGKRFLNSGGEIFHNLNIFVTVFEGALMSGENCSIIMYRFFRHRVAAPRLEDNRHILPRFIGYAKDLYDMLSEGESLKDDDDDQLFYTLIYLDEKKRAKYGMKLDHQSHIFQNLNGALGEVELLFRGKEAYLQNTAYGTVPLVVHGNGPSKVSLNSLGNYLAKAWNPQDGCLECKENMIDLEHKDVRCVPPHFILKAEKEWPQVLIAIFIEQATPFFEEFLNRIEGLVYPKSKIHLFIHNAAEFHEKDVKEFVDQERDPAYASVKLIHALDNIKEWHAHNLAMEHAVKKDCEWVLSIESTAHLDNPYALRLLIEQNRTVLAPLMIRPYRAWSNFWGALTSDGFYARSFDYMDIIQGEKRGVWNVPYISSAYIIHRSIIKDKDRKPSYIKNLLDPDMAFCENLREKVRPIFPIPPSLVKGISMFVTNRLDWGHLVDPENFETTHLHNELFEIINNRWDWEKRYIHPNYSQSLQEDAVLSQPCPDVFWFPMVSDRYAKELIEELETFGRWSDGTNYDPRLQGSYENVPTVDIHMKQIGFEEEWLHFLREYVRPLQELAFKGYTNDDPRIEGGYENVPTVDIHLNQVGLEKQWLFFLKEYVYPLVQKAFQGYESDPPTAIMNFVVRYKPDEQPSLRPHHDSSTYTINIALNRAGVDFQGGGCRFPRYDCSVNDTKLGWLIMHPGGLTHLHEGLPVTNGTRYILVSFVDPDESELETCGDGCEDHNDLVSQVFYPTSSSSSSSSGPSSPANYSSPTNSSSPSNSSFSLNLTREEEEDYSEEDPLDYWKPPDFSRQAYGGGCQFLRYNCSIRATKRGWMLMHPGRLTHLHEGLPVTKGVRYIQISFVDP